jgi:cell division transport system permease protein
MRTRRPAATRTRRTAPPPERPAPRSSRSRAGLRTRAAGYLLRHLQVLFFSLGRAWRSPLSTLLTSAVIGIALALPTGLYVVLGSAQQLGAGWEGAAQISVFLKDSVDERGLEELAAQVRGWAEVRTVEPITRSAALEEFRRTSGFGAALDALDENPLPAVLVVQPASAEPEPAAALLERLQRLPDADLAQLDLEWVQRLAAALAVAGRAVLVIGGLLGLAVLLIVGNTIRLDIQNRREEIIVTKLVGATDAFVRRPFLYAGLWYGVLGGALAWLLVSVSLWLLAGPVQRLSGLYGSGYSTPGLDLASTLALIGIGAVLGVLGSWLAVARHLGTIEPS